MELKLAAVFAAQATGGVVPVTEICANLGICRQTYYKYRRRYQAEGSTGLEARSRRPLTSPMLTGPEATERIIRARKRLHEEGWDNGALSIWYWLLREGGQAPPAVRTIHRVVGPGRPGRPRPVQGSSIPASLPVPGDRRLLAVRRVRIRPRLTALSWSCSNSSTTTPGTWSRVWSGCMRTRWAHGNAY